jgi:hypothetical protein
VADPVHLVRNVAKHDGGANVAAIEDALTTDTVVLISWVTPEGSRRDRVESRTITDEATLVIDTRLVAVRRVGSAFACPRKSDGSDPLERLLKKS